MKKLSHEAFEQTRHSFLQEARQLERTLFPHRFEDADAEGALNALGAFQNPEDRFGRALEPDLRSPSSSALAAAIGLPVSF